MPDCLSEKNLWSFPYSAVILNTLESNLTFTWHVSILKISFNRHRIRHYWFQHKWFAILVPFSTWRRERNGVMPVISQNSKKMYENDKTYHLCFNKIGKRSPLTTRITYPSILSPGQYQFISCNNNYRPILFMGNLLWEH